MDRGQVTPTIPVAKLKAQPLSAAVARLDEAHRLGMSHLDVLNRGRAIFHLGREEDLPRQWRSAKPEPLPHVDLRKGKVSLSRLRSEGKVFLLTQRSGPSLVLWPLVEDYARPPEVATTERLDALERQIKALRRDNDHLQATLDRLADVLLELGFGPRPRRSGKPTRKPSAG